MRARNGTAPHLIDFFAAHSPCVGQLLQSVVPGQYGQPTRLPDMIVGDIAVRLRRESPFLHGAVIC